MGDGGDDIGWLLARLEEHLERSAPNGSAPERADLPPPAPDGGAEANRAAAPPVPPPVAVRPVPPPVHAGPVFLRHLRRPRVRALVDRVRTRLLPH